MVVILAVLKPEGCALMVPQRPPDTYSPSKSALEAGAHEAGHTVGLSHDGTSTSGYYGGHGNSSTGWGPIMGAVYTRPRVQWSKGEYSSANMKQDDLLIISSAKNGCGYRIDDHGNSPTNATLLIQGSGSSIKKTDNFGIIERRTDKDVFKFSTDGGNISLIFSTITNFGSGSVPDLDIQARLLDNSGTELAKSNPGGLTAVISKNIAAGTYFLEVDGVGYLNPLNTGYSDYGSLGQFFISGNIPPSTGLGIEGADNKDEINIYPNPNSGSFTISLMLNSTDEGSIEILNSLGQVVMTSSEKVSGKYQKEIDLSAHSKGIYCVVIREGNDVWKKKVIIK